MLLLFFLPRVRPTSSRQLTRGPQVSQTPLNYLRPTVINCMRFVILRRYTKNNKNKNKNENVFYLQIVQIAYHKYTYKTKYNKNYI